MDDIISRQSAIDAIEAMQMPIMRSTSVEKQFVFKGMSDALNAIKELPSAEPQERKGKWEQVEVSYLADMDAEIKESMAIASMFCPKCKRYHNEVYMYGNPTYGVNYCPNCGARMEAEQLLSEADNDTAYGGLMSAT